MRGIDSGKLHQYASCDVTSALKRAMDYKGKIQENRTNEDLYHQHFSGQSTTGNLHGPEYDTVFESEADDERQKRQKTSSIYPTESVTRTEAHGSGLLRQLLSDEPLMPLRMGQHADTPRSRQSKGYKLSFLDDSPLGRCGRGCCGSLLKTSNIRTSVALEILSPMARHVDSARVEEEKMKRLPAMESSNKGGLFALGSLSHLDKNHTLQNSNTESLTTVGEKKDGERGNAVLRKQKELSVIIPEKKRLAVQSSGHSKSGYKDKNYVTSLAGGTTLSYPKPGRTLGMDVAPSKNLQKDFSGFPVVLLIGTRDEELNGLSNLEQGPHFLVENKDSRQWSFKLNSADGTQYSVPCHVWNENPRNENAQYSQAPALVGHVWGESRLRQGMQTNHLTAQVGEGSRLREVMHGNQTLILEKSSKVSDNLYENDTAKNFIPAHSLEADRLSPLREIKDQMLDYITELPLEKLGTPSGIAAISPSAFTFDNAALSPCGYSQYVLGGNSPGDLGHSNLLVTNQEVQQEISAAI